MSKAFYREMSITLFILLLFVGILAIVGEIRSRDLESENEQLKLKLLQIK